jgi:hypothetical protein
MSTSQEDSHLDKLSKAELATLALERAQKVGYIALRARPETSRVKELEDQLPNGIADIVIAAKQRANVRVS